MDLNQLKNALLARFDSLDVTMRQIEIAGDDELKNAPMGRVTFATMLAAIPTYAEVARNTGALSENLQRRLHDAVTELFVIITLAPQPEFDVDAIKSEIDDAIVGVLQVNDAHRTCAMMRDVYPSMIERGYFDNPETATGAIKVTRRNIAIMLAAALVIEDTLVTIDLDSLI